MKQIIAILAMLLLAAPAEAQRTNPALLATSVQTAETVFDNGGQPWNLLAQINAENYDKGGQGVAFNQPNIGAPVCQAVPLAGQMYRPDFVDLYTSTDGPQFQVGCSTAGVYYKYQVVIPTGSMGPYQLKMRVANIDPMAAQTTWTAFIDGVSVGSVNGVTTANLNTFAVLTIGGTSGFNATVGQHTLKLLADDPTKGGLRAGEISSFIASPVGGIAVPSVAQAAGFTTLAANYDFSTAAFAEPNTNWLDCQQFGHGDATKFWHMGSPGVPSLACNIHQVVDNANGGDGSTVVRVTLPASTDCSNTSAPFCSVAMETTTIDHNDPAFDHGLLPRRYWETVARIEPPFITGANGTLYNFPQGVFEWAQNAHFGSSYAGSEIDTIEFQYDGGGYANDGVAHWAAAGCPPDCNTAWTSYSPMNMFIPPGWAPGSYHKYASLETSDGATSLYYCFFIDDILQQPCFIPACSANCTNGAAAGDYTQRHFPILVAYAHGGTCGGGSCASAGIADGQPWPIFNDRKLDVKYIRAWSCSTWTGIDGDDTGLCNTGASGKLETDANNVVYWCPANRVPACP